MTFINQAAGSGASNGYMILESNPSTASGHKVFWAMIHGSYKSSYFITINTNDWVETYKSSGFDAVYEESSKGWYLNPNRKILIELQFYPEYFDLVGTSGKFAKFRFGLRDSGISGEGSYLHYYNRLLTPTYHMENNAILVETSNTSSTYKAIVSHSESSSKPIGFYMESDSDQNFNITPTNQTHMKDAASKIKITQLD